MLKNIGYNRVFYKVRTTRHQYPKFDPKPGEIQENLQKSTFALKGVKFRNAPLFVPN
jgi:hypothetical protein